MPGNLSNSSIELSRLTVGISAVIGALTAAGFFFWLRKYQANRPPKKWRKVGELSDLICYPIKSCSFIKAHSMHCSKIGLEDGELKDRIFMIISTNGEFITGRQYPKLTKVEPRVRNKTMSLSAPGMLDIDVDIERLRKVPPIKCQVWGQTVTAVDCGEEVARWFSRYLLQDDFGMRLVYYPDREPTREVRSKFRHFVSMSAEDTGALHDSTSFNLINDGSLHELNSRLDKPVHGIYFRPNFVVKGPVAFAEDTWKWVKIGETVFKNVKPCTRCKFTTVDPDDGTFRPDGDPLKALNEYRIFKENGLTPSFGINLGVRLSGTVKVGDPVYVEEK